MKKMKFPLLAAFAVMAVAAKTQDGTFLIRHDLVAGHEDVYQVNMKFKQSIDVPNMGPQDMDITGSMKYAISTGAPDATSGKADMTMKVTDMKMDMTGSAAQMAGNMADQMPKEYTIKAKIDNRNRVTDYKLDGQSAQMMMMASSMSTTSSTFIELPEKPVKVGDTWEITIPAIKQFGLKESHMTAKLVAEKDFNGVPAYQITMAGPLMMDMDLAEMMKNMPDAANSPAAGMEMMIKGTIELDSEALVEKKGGRTASMSTKMKSKMKMEMPQMGMTMDMGGDGVYTMKLAK